MSPALRQVHDDIYQVALPLPFALRIINAYLVRGDDEWTIIDSGLNTTAARHTWLDVFESLGIGETAVSQIIVTHGHPDHYGMAGWLQEWFGKNGKPPPVRMSAKEFEIVKRVWHDLDGWTEQSAQFWQICGLPEEIATAVSQSGYETGRRTMPHPNHIELLEAGQTIAIGNRMCTILEEAGHSDGQLLLHDAGDGLLFCADHVLNKITPNISLWPYSHPDPLGEYLESFGRLAALDVQLALPGHGPLISNLNERMNEIEAHHEARLALTLTAVTQPQTVHQVSRALFNHEKLSIHEMRFALTETLAHLEYLRNRGKLERLGDELWTFQPA